MKLCIIQARMGSTRLPGKVLKTIAGKSMLEHVVYRLRPSKLVDKIVVATTILKEDDAIEEACKAMGVDVYRGSDWDVLDRFYQAATQYTPHPEVIVRICCDNPTHHFEAMDFVVQQFLDYGLDYFSNGNEGPDYYEDGFTAEVFTFASLEKAAKEATLMSEREHVTPYIKRSGKFSCGWRKISQEYQYKLSVDTAEDFSKSEQIFRDLGGLFNMQELLQYLKEHPSIAVQDPTSFNVGYQKSLKEDRKVK